MATFMCFSSSTKQFPRGNLILFILTLLRWWQQKEWMAHPLNRGLKPAAQVEGRSFTVSSSVQCITHVQAFVFNQDSSLQFQLWMKRCGESILWSQAPTHCALLASKTWEIYILYIFPISSPERRVQQIAQSL